MSSQKILKVHPNDNLIVALQNLEAGTVLEVEGQTLILPEAVERKHKFVQHDVAEQQELRMYGVTVGKANVFLPKGSVISTRNVSHKTTKISARTPRTNWAKPDVSKWADQTFLGYKRSDGSVGTANYWLVFPLVFCENKNIEVLKEALNEALGYSKYHRYKAFARQLVEKKRPLAYPLTFPCMISRSRPIMQPIPFSTWMAFALSPMLWAVEEPDRTPTRSAACWLATLTIAM